MSNTQLFFAIAGLVTGLISAQTVVLVLYINAKVDPIKGLAENMMGFMVSHEGRIAG
jgi:hypothetical protein